jgi:hypothetical protein
MPTHVLWRWNHNRMEWEQVRTLGSAYVPHCSRFEMVTRICQNPNKMGIVPA